MWLRQDASNLQDDVVQHVDHGAGAELPAEAAGPEILIVSGLQQCHVDLDLVSGCADAALQHIVDVDVRNGSAKCRPGAGTRSEVAAEDEHVLETDQPADHVLGDAFGKRAPETVGQLGLLQPRTRTLDGTPHDLFTLLYPVMPVNNVQARPIRCRSPSCPTVSGALIWIGP